MEFLKKIFRRKKIFDNKEIAESFKKELLEKPKERTNSWKKEGDIRLKEIKKVIRKRKSNQQKKLL